MLLIADQEHHGTGYSIVYSNNGSFNIALNMMGDRYTFGMVTDSQPNLIGDHGQQYVTGGLKRGT